MRTQGKKSKWHDIGLEGSGVVRPDYGTLAGLGGKGLAWLLADLVREIPAPT